MSANNDISMNEELRRWVKEAKDKINLSNDKKHISNKPTGKCQICGERTSKAVCLKCGKSVCVPCHFKIIGVCKKCIPKDVAGKWDGSNPDWENKLGVKWIE